MSPLITEELQPFVTDAVHSGRYVDETAVVTAALRLLRELHSDELVQKINEALDQSRQDDVITIEDDSAHAAYFENLSRRATQTPALDE